MKPLSKHVCSRVANGIVLYCMHVWKEVLFVRPSYIAITDDEFWEFEIANFRKEHPDIIFCIGEINQFRNTVYK